MKKCQSNWILRSAHARDLFRGHEPEVEGSSRRYQDCVGFSDSLVLPQQVKTRSGGYLDHGGEGIWVKELFCGLPVIHTDQSSWFGTHVICGSADYTKIYKLCVSITFIRFS